MLSARPDGTGGIYRSGCVASNSPHTPNIKFLVVAAAPPPPTSLTTTAASASGINLAWTDNANKEGRLRIEHCPGTRCTNFADIETVAADVSAYHDTGLPAGFTARYRVRAYNTRVTPAHLSPILVFAFLPARCALLSRAVVGAYANLNR